MQYIKSPFNYIGGKHELLHDLFQLFPQNIKTFVDIFCGGFNVGVNVFSTKVICNDIVEPLIACYELFKNTKFEILLKNINDVIKIHGLSKTNKDGFNNLRMEYNLTKEPLLFFVLCCYSFNYDYCFNNSGKFNNAFGYNRSSFNDSIKFNLANFCRKLQKMDIEFSLKHFSEVEISEDSFYYCDPPYLITDAVYNRPSYFAPKGWNEEQEYLLLRFLDDINNAGGKFCLSNVFECNGKSNDILKKWAKDYHVTFLNKKYGNCNHGKVVTCQTIEVAVTNYKPPEAETKQLKLGVDN